MKILQQTYQLIKKVKGITSTVTVVVIPDMGGREDDASEDKVIDNLSKGRTKGMGSPFLESGSSFNLIDRYHQFFD